MKKVILLTLCMCAASLYAQQEPPPLYLEYDNAGNQVISDLVCVNCPGAAEKHSLDNITYYPNPVAQELNLTWENTDDSNVTTIRVYTLSGKLIASRDNLDLKTALILNFSDKTSGIYVIEFLSSDGEKKSIKVIKK